MYILELNNKNIWENFLLECKEKTFLDSWNWGEFQKREGGKIWRFGIYDNEQLISVALVVKIKAKRGTFLFVPHGPNVNNQDTRNNNQILETLTNKLKEIAKQEKAHFIRIAPIWERNEENIEFFKNFGFRNAPIHIHPEVTWELDIRPPEGELLMSMRKTTRYLIRQAQKNPDIEIVKTQNIEDLKKFNEIYQKTAQRHHFTPFSLDYLEKQFSSFLPDDQPIRQRVRLRLTRSPQGCPECTEGQILIFLGKYKNEVVSSVVIVYWQNIGFYHHGASLSKYNKIPVSYLLQWEAIKEAKNRECQRYNFWGITPDDNKNHPWAGLSLFKKGFGGHRKDYVQTQDLPLSKIYYLTFIFEKMRKIKRGL